MITERNVDTEMNQVRQEIARYARKAYEEKLVAGTSGNISAYFPPYGLMVITPSGYGYEGIDGEDMVIMDLNGKVSEGRLKPSSEWRMHAQIYKRIPWVRSVVHTHSPYATSFAVLNKEIPQFLIEMQLFLKGSIEVSPYAQQGSDQVGINAVPYLMEKNACLLANHGVVAVGETVGEAYMNSVYAEDSARIYHLALSVGEPVIIK